MDFEKKYIHIKNMIRHLSKGFICNPLKTMCSCEISGFISCSTVYAHWLIGVRNVAVYST